MNDNKITIFAIIVLATNSIIIPHFSQGIVNPVYINSPGKPEIVSPWNVLWSLISFNVSTEAWVVSFVYDLILIALLIMVAKLIRGVSA